MSSVVGILIMTVKKAKKLSHKCSKEVEINSDSQKSTDVKRAIEEELRISKQNVKNFDVTNNCDAYDFTPTIPSI